MNEAVSLKAQMNLAAEQGMSHGMLDVDFKVRPRGAQRAAARLPRAMRTHAPCRRHGAAPMAACVSLLCALQALCADARRFCV